MCDLSEPANEQPNHDALADYLWSNFQQDGLVEFFGCNDGEGELPPTDRVELPVLAIRDLHFHFNIGTVYRFLIPGGGRCLNPAQLLLSSLGNHHCRSTTH